MESFAFKRHQRLLTSRDYKQAFDQATYRFSTPALLVLAAERAPTEPSRLGIVASKKHLKLAVQRNRFKRVVRESFRQHQQQLVGLDLVVLVRAGAKNTEKQELRNILAKAWPYIVRKREKQRSQQGTDKD